MFQKSFRLAALLILVGCAHSRYQYRPVQEPTVFQQGYVRTAGLHGRVTDHVVVISIDGLRADAVEKFNAPTLHRLMREGRYSLTAQTIPTSLTLPSHTSMLTGVGADQHHITWNSDKTRQFGYVKVPTVFGLAHSAGFATAAFFSKTKFHHLEVPGTLDFARAPTSDIRSPWGEERTTGYVEEYLKNANPNLLFVHLAEPDFIGHNFGWMGHMYGNAVREADLGVSRVLRDADERFGRGNYTLIVTADHGGHKKSHGTTQAVDMTIPWIVWGQGVQQGAPLSGIKTMDTAATVMWLLGLEQPSNWVGRPVTGAFQAAYVER
ncbi:MAG TPA: alkaline phosphatase family protein [Gemmatimonadaceae bacterium]|nr:alkaline phosphatase family protein [Gemmatimonadaceae bacterium]